MPKHANRPLEEIFGYLDSIEEEIFDKYLEQGSFRKLLAWINEDFRIGMEMTYRWLKASDERWSRWQQAIELRGHLSYDEAQEEARIATPQNASAQRLKYEAKKWAAEVQNRHAYGRQPEINVALGVGEEWLQALVSADNPKQLTAPKNREPEIKEAQVIEEVDDQERAQDDEIDQILAGTGPAAP